MWPTTIQVIIVIAMANGQDIVKKTAKFIAPTNNDNGVFKVLNKYLDEAE